MKWIKLFEDFENGKLYHFTSPSNANNILKEDKIKKSIQGGVYFTRDKYHKFSYQGFRNNPNVGLIFDRNCVKNNNKLFPKSNLEDRTQSIEYIPNDFLKINKCLIEIIIPESLFIKIKNADYDYLLNDNRIKIINWDKL